MQENGFQITMFIILAIFILCLKLFVSPTYCSSNVTVRSIVSYDILWIIPPVYDTSNLPRAGKVTFVMST